MATNYPSGIDSLTNPSAGDALTSPSHSAQHANANDAIEAIETELGTTPSGSETTVAARLTAIESGARMGTGSIGATALADNAVDTAAIADGAVTPAKLATSGRFTFPTGAANGYGFTSGAVHLSGTGTPEGVVTAAPGSTWLQTDATTDVKGWIRWVKATGTGNTGWVAGAEADTGWRDVSSLLINSWTAAKLRMRRVGSRVEVMSGLLKGGATLTTQMLDIPAGFALSADAVNGILFREDGVAGTPGWLIAAGTTLNAYGAMFDGSSWTVNHGVSMETSWLTNDGWPTSLPGSAA